MQRSGTAYEGEGLERKQRTSSAHAGVCPAGVAKGVPLRLKLTTFHPLATALRAIAEPTKPFPPKMPIFMS